MIDFRRPRRRRRRSRNRRSVNDSSSGSGPCPANSSAASVALRIGAGLVAPIQPDPAELAHVAEEQPSRPLVPTVAGDWSRVERQPQVDVAVMARAGWEDEELPGHLDLDGEDRATVEAR